MVNASIVESLYSVADQFIGFIPDLVLVIVLIIVGLILGKSLDIYFCIDKYALLQNNVLAQMF